MIWICGWLLCSVVAYVSMRFAIRRDFGMWTVGDRIFAIGLALLFAPGAVVVAGVMALVAAAGAGCFNKPASW